MYYVTMTDRFFSGWGRAEGKLSKFIIECETYEQAEQIKAVAKTRSEMRYINIRSTKPYYDSRKYYSSWKTYEQMTGWHK